MSETPSKAVLRLQSSIKQLQMLKGSTTVGELAQAFALDIETHELALAEIASLRAQLDEARARVKTFEMAIAQLPEMPAIMDERAARRRAIEDAANVVAHSVFPLPTDAEIARDGGGIAVMRAAAMARDAIEQQIRALLSESKS